MPSTSTAAVAPRALEMSHKCVPPRNARYTATIAAMESAETASLQVSIIAGTTFPIMKRYLQRRTGRRGAGSGQRSPARGPWSPLLLTSRLMEDQIYVGNAAVD